MPTICLAIIYSVQFSLVFHNRSQSRLGLKKLSNYQLIVSTILRAFFSTVNSI
jgi:hypothetical protein